MRQDTQLIADYLVGDEKSLEVLIERYMKAIYHFVHTYINDTQEAEDITQEVFVRVWKNLKKFDPNMSFRTWIFTIAKRVCIDAFKKKKTLTFSMFENENGENALLNELIDEAPLPDAMSERKGIAHMVTSASDFLSRPYQAVLLLRYQDDLTFAGIAEKLHEPLHTVKSRHRRALASLKKILGGSDFNKK